ncbi:MAG TPA: hypothetical protein VFW62_11935 [bacterium]|nr:hypothetical protein [bacterium]
MPMISLQVLAPLPFFFLGGVLGRLLSSARPFPWAQSLVWTLAAMTVLPMAAGGLGGNFADVLLFSALLALALGFFGLVLTRLQVRFADARESEGFPWLYLLLTLLSAALVGLVGFGVSIHDETAIQSHPAVIERILRQGLPAGLAAFPEIPLKYHYGFNVLAAVFSESLGLPAWQAIDLLNILLWIAACLSLGSLLRRLGLSPGLRALALFWILLGAGWMWWERPDVWQHSYYYGRHMKPMLLSWFFQHPVALGLPIFFSGLEYWIQYQENGEKKLFAASAVLTGILSFAQVVLFGGLFAGIGVDLLRRFWRQRGDRLGPFGLGLAFAGISLGLASGLGGFFTSDPAYQGGLTQFSWPPGFLRNEYFSRSPLEWSQAVEWYLLNFGSPLFLFPPAAWWVWRKKLWALTVPLTIAILGFFIPQFLQYRLSWDVMKFFLLFDLTARLVIAAVFLPMLNAKLWRWALALALLGTSAVDPVSFLAKLGFTPAEKLPFFAKELIGGSHSEMTRKYAQLLAKLKESRPGGFVLANPSLSRLISVHTGLPVLEWDWNTEAFGLRTDLLDRRRGETLKFWNRLNYRQLRERGVDWVLWPCQDDPRFSAEAKASMAAEIAAGAFASYVFMESGICVRGLEVRRQPAP